MYRRPGRPPNFAVLRAMLFYVDEFPERLHHTKESGLLFPAVRAHGGAAAPRSSSPPPTALRGAGGWRAARWMPFSVARGRRPLQPPP